MSLHTVCSLIPTPPPPHRAQLEETNARIRQTNHACTHARTSCLRAARHGDLVPSTLKSPRAEKRETRTRRLAGWQGWGGLRRAGEKRSTTSVRVHRPRSCSTSSSDPSSPLTPLVGCRQPVTEPSTASWNQTVNNKP